MSDAIDLYGDTLNLVKRLQWVLKAFYRSADLSNLIRKCSDGFPVTQFNYTSKHPYD